MKKLAVVFAVLFASGCVKSVPCSEIASYQEVTKAMAEVHKDDARPIQDQISGMSGAFQVLYGKYCK